MKNHVLCALFVVLSLETKPLAAAEIHEAAKAGDLSALERLIAAGEDLNAKVEVTAFTPWQVARIYGREEIATLLAKAGARTDLPFPAPEETLDRLLQKSVKSDEPGFAILVARDGKVLFERGYGSADLERKEPVTPGTVFRIGSVTKQFVASAILLCEQDGKLRTSDPLSRFFPGYPLGDKITLHHLLTHTSGIKSFTSLPDFMEHVTESRTPDEMVARFQNQPPDFEPGAGFAYCNSGYFLLGEVVRKVAGQTYLDLLQDRVFIPEHMFTTGAHRPSLGLANEAKGYASSDGKWKPAVDWHMSQAGGAGEIFSTVGDLFRWNEALFHDRVISAESLKKAFTPVQAPAFPAGGGLNGKYAYGWVVDEVRGLRTVWHTGGLNGFSSELRRFPGQNLTVVVLCNAMEPVGGLSTSLIAGIAARQYLWQEMKAQPCFRDLPLAEGVKLADYEGAYDFSGLGVLRCRATSNRLQVRLADQPWSFVRHADRDQFRNDTVDATFVFERDDKGVTTRVKLQQHGAALEGVRFQEPVSLAARPEELRELNGTYELMAGKMVFRADEKNGTLLGRLGAQPELVYHRAEGDAMRYFCKSIRVEVLFTRAGDGKISGFILQQGAAAMPAQRLGAH